MSTAAVVRARFPRAVANFNHYAGGSIRAFNKAGHLTRFAVNGGWSIGWALRHYRRETLRLIAHQGFASLGNIGVEAFTGFFAALANVRVVTAVVTGVALAATVGAGATAELGAMRISEEIDALEVMGIKSVAFLVSTRLMAGLVVVVPLYAMALVMSFLSGQVVTTLFYGQSEGTYEHYFRTFLRTRTCSGRVARSS